MTIIGKNLATLAIGAALGGLASGVFAGGFAIGTQSGSGTGNAFAGGAAAADDASVAWYNPAAMTLLPAGRQVAGALHALRPSFKFQNQGSTGVYAAAGTGDGGDGGDWNFVPNAFFTTDINPRWRFGLALNVPFGLKTDYDNGWRGQLTALKSEIKSVNINPSVGFKLNDQVSLGFGVSVQRIEADLTSFAGAAAGIATLGADDTGYGFNLGFAANASPSTRFGATYRSSIDYDLEGTATFSGPAGPLLGSGIRADLKVPDSASLSVFHKLNPKWELMGDITWTGWSSVKQLVIVRTSATGAGAAAGSTLSTLLFNWKDTWRFGVGANYRMNDRTKFRFGVALDETPTNDVDRTPRLPDQDRTWVAVGMQYRLSKAGVLDLGYAHEFVKDARVNNTVPGFATCAAGCLTGSFDNEADIFSVQYSHSF
ncbi:MAG: outer membrane protein transport protein [Betaproteobacteria bacterium]|nr:outer membrane protein transport protein [Betaproteobacteria bacterium]